jgi:hypothetical protein
VGANVIGETLAKQPPTNIDEVEPFKIEEIFLRTIWQWWSVLMF